MPFSFIVLGITIIYLILYRKNNQHYTIHHYVILYAICLFFGFLLPNIQISDNITFNIVFCLLLPLPAFHFMKGFSPKQNILLLFLIISTTFGYIMISQINYEFYSMISFQPLFYIVMATCLLFLNKPKFGVAYIILSYLATELMNVVFALKLIGYISVASISFINYLCFSIVIFCFVSYLTKKIICTFQKRRVFYEN